MKPANKSEHRLLQSSTLLLSLVGRILKMWVCKIQDLKIKALNIFPKLKLLLTYFFQKANKESLTMTVKRLLPVIALFRFTTFLGMRFKDIRTMTTCPINTKMIGTRHFIQQSKAKKKKKNRCLFIVRRCLRAPEKYCFGCSKKRERYKAHCKSVSFI